MTDSRRAVRKLTFFTTLKGPGVILFCGLLLSGGFSLLYIYKPALLYLVDNKIYDVMLRSLPKTEGSGIPVIVDLDEKSLAEFGQWPWPRYRIAQLLEKLKQSGVLGVGLDMMFAEPDRTSLVVLQQEILRDLNVSFSFEGLPEVLYDNDKILTETLSDSPIILGYKFLFDPPSPPFSSAHCHLHPLEMVMLQEQDQSVDAKALFSALDVSCNLPELSQAVQMAGFLNSMPDRDGSIRRSPLLIMYNNEFYPSLALATLMQTMRSKQAVLKIASGDIEYLDLKNIRIPLDAQGNLLIRYRGPKKFFEYFSAGDILHDCISKEKLQGKIVLLGTSAAGLPDIHPTPFDAVYPGVEVHATILDNILKGDFLSRPQWVMGAECLSVFVLGILSSFLLAWTRAFKSVLILGLIAFGLWYGSQWMLQFQGIFISPLVSSITLIGNFSLLTLMKFWFEEKKVKERTRELFIAQNFTILSLTALAETRDNETGGHIIRTQRYVRILAEHLASHPRFQKFLDQSTIDFLYKSAPLHDIGKVGIRDNILLKPGRLTPQEFEEMKRHTIYGWGAITKAEEALGIDLHSSFLRLAREIAYTHHERWDGLGYPQGLRGEEIPIPGRIMALADVYDALISKRIYKSPIEHEKAIDIILKDREKHFDPDIVDAFIELEGKFREIALEFADFEEERTMLLKFRSSHANRISLKA